MSAPSNPAPDFTLAQAKHIGAAFQRSGYLPVPVKCRDKYPVTEKWQIKARSGQFEPTSGVTNVGLMCDGLRVLDVDCDDPAMAAKVRALADEVFGQAPERFRDNSPRFLRLYLSADGEHDKRSVKSDIGAVEILAKGQQFVACGVHETGAKIQWRGLLRNKAPIPRGELPQLSAAQVDDFLAQAAKILETKARVATAAKANTPASAEELKARDPDALAEIVRQIPNDSAFDDRNMWVAFAHAVAASFAPDAERAKRIWLRFCDQRPQKDGESERVWITLDNNHEVGEQWLLRKAEACGIDVSHYTAAVAREQFSATASMPAAIAEGQASASSAVWPPNFFMTPTGLVYQQPNATSVEICGSFEVLAETRDVGSENWGLELAWKDRDCRPHRWAMPIALLHKEGGEIASQLSAAGLSCTPGRGPQNLLKLALAGVKTTRRLTCVEKSGWHASGGSHVFVLPSGDVFGSAGGSIVLQTNSAKAADAFGQAGTLTEWQDAIGRYGVGNSRLALFLSAALAGPLLDIVAESSGGFHLVGKSQSGKSSCAFAAGSVWGCGDRGGQVRSWRATANGLEGVAAECSDTVLILDELGQADGRDVGDIVYGVANEAGKARATRTGEARARKTWHLIMLSTGEVSLAAKMATANHQAQAGQEVRLSTLPADAGAGLGAFESIHDLPHAGALADRLRAAAKASYGSAGRAFLARLTEALSADEAELRARIAAAREAFIVQHVPAGADGQVRSVAGRFGVIAAAGELAIEYDVLPWPPGEATRAAAVCFSAWLAERGGAGAGEDATAIAQVRAFIEAHGESRFAAIEYDSNTKRDVLVHSNLRTISRVGFRRRTVRGKLEVFEYLVLPEAWRNEVCQGLNAKRAAQALENAGFLECEGTRSTVRRSLPGHGSLRVYAVLGSILLIPDEPETQSAG